MSTPMIRSKLTRVCIPSSARRLQGRPGSTGTPPNQNLNESTFWRTIDVERLRADLKTYKIQDEVMRENLRWGSRFYKTMEWSSYVILSVSTAAFIACEVVVRSREKDLQAGLICEL